MNKSRMLGTKARSELWFSASADLNCGAGGFGSIITKAKGLVVGPEIGTAIPPQNQDRRRHLAVAGPLPSSLHPDA